MLVQGGDTLAIFSNGPYSDDCAKCAEVAQAVNERDRLREALLFCEAQMTIIFCGHEKAPCFGAAIDAARAVLNRETKP